MYFCQLQASCWTNVNINEVQSTLSSLHITCPLRANPQTTRQAFPTKDIVRDTVRKCASRAVSFRPFDLSLCPLALITTLLQTGTTSYIPHQSYEYSNKAYFLLF